MKLNFETHIVMLDNFIFTVNKRQRTPKGQSKLDNPEKLATQGTQKQNKNTAKYVSYTYICKQTQIT